MSLAKELNTVANNVTIQKHEEICQRARAIYENFKPTMKHYASRGYYDTNYMMPPSEARKENRVDVLAALKAIFIAEGFQVHSFDTATNSFVVSWENVGE